MKTRIIGIASVVAALSLMAVIPVFAQAGDDLPAGGSNTAAAITAANRAAYTQQRLASATAKGAQAITARIASLNKLSTRIQSMKNLSASQAGSFQAGIQTAIAGMTTLQSKIQSDTSTTTLMADLKTVAPDYRIYMLIEPQISLLSAADRVNTIVSTLQTFATKIQTRLSAATGLSDIATLQADLTDMNAKISDASAQAAAATAEVSGLMPDNGVATVLASNTAALKDARSKIQTATADLKAADKDAQTIVQGVKGKGLTPASTTTTTSASSTTNTP